MHFSGNWDADLFILESFLDLIDFYAGTERRQMIKKAGGKLEKDSGSMLYGLTWKSYLSPTKNRTKCEKTGLYKTKVKDLNPELEDIFREFSNIYFPDFIWTQVQLNKNFKCPPHRDSQNIGESVLISCGDYKGGLTAVDINNKIVKFDSRKSPVKFNGAKHLHWVEPYTDKRYSLVFFNNNKLFKN